MLKTCKIPLPVDRREVWPDGLEITFYKIPLPFRRKPVVSGAAPASIKNVSLDLVFASQKTVTDVGLCGQIRGMPYVYLEIDGTYTVGDGHHRIVRALLQGKKFLKMRVVRT